MEQSRRNPRIAFVHDWLFRMRGGERCLDELCRLFPDADIYTLFYRPARISPEINRHRIEASLLNRLPFVERWYRFLLPLYPIAVASLSRKLKQERYDLVISISHCVAKNVRSRPGTPHLCYCLTPARYFWDQFDAYFGDSPIRFAVSPIIRALRSWDRRAAQPGTRYLAISRFVRERIQRVWGEESTVIYPPVRTDWIRPCGAGEPGKGFLCVNALVPYKRVDRIIAAFNELGAELTVIGDGPEAARLQRDARENIRFYKYLTESDLAAAYAGTKALVFAAEEDFGIIPLEVQAAGRPVICLGAGGALETVVFGEGDRADSDGRTGLLFPEPTAPAIVGSVKKFLREESSFSRDSCVENAGRFSVGRFQQAILGEVRRILDGVDHRC